MKATYRNRCKGSAYGGGVVVVIVVVVVMLVVRWFWLRPRW